jgi:hypothetical protein
MVAYRCYAASLQLDFCMEENGKSANAKRQLTELQEMKERCQAMENELEHLKKQMLDLQHQVKMELAHRAKAR